MSDLCSTRVLILYALSHCCMWILLFFIIVPGQFSISTIRKRYINSMDLQLVLWPLSHVNFILLCSSHPPRQSCRRDKMLFMYLGSPLFVALPIVCRWYLPLSISCLMLCACFPWTLSMLIRYAGFIFSRFVWEGGLCAHCLSTVLYYGPCCMSLKLYVLHIEVSRIDAYILPYYLVPCFVLSM